MHIIYVTVHCTSQSKCNVQYQAAGPAVVLDRALSPEAAGFRKVPNLTWSHGSGKHRRHANMIENKIISICNDHVEKQQKQDKTVSGRQVTWS